MAGQGWQTLPLFDSIDGPVNSARMPSGNGRSPRDLILHVYWSASLEAHALGSAAASNPYRDQRTAMAELQELEMDCQDLAAHKLQALWGISLPGAPRGDSVDDDGQGHKQAA
jgi:hypothetical protein